MDIRTFCRDVANAYAKQNQERICELILVDDANPDLVALQQTLYSMPAETIRSTVQAEMQSAPRPLRDFVTNYLLFTIASALENSAFADVYELMSTCFGSFLSLYQFPDAQWLTQLLKNLSFSLVDWAIVADKENPGAKELKISDAAAKHLARAFNIVISDKVIVDKIQDSKKNALYYLANLTFRVYFKLKSTRLIPTMLANISKAGVKLKQFPMSQRVTQSYYLGRYYLYQLDLRTAEHYLGFAFRNCVNAGDAENEAVHWNSHLILIYLTACRLCLGKMPSLQLLQAYDLDMYFSPLITAIKLGDLALLQDTLESGRSDWYIKKEIYFLLKEKLTLLCWRSLFRRASLVAHQPNPQQVRVQLQDFLVVAQKLTRDDSYDVLDIECVIASLMDQGYIRGYIHSPTKILVLSNNNPFPVIYSIKVVEDA
ncbi:hypothetical protein BGZ82_006093 [Podila clonocystis]|nr:hypothetical protein BGZ82_006093 [Podila clonocystis]